MAVPAMLVYTQQNTKNIYFGPLKANTSPFAPVTDGTVVCTLYKGRIPGEATGTPVAGVSNISFNHVGGGVYVATVGDENFTPDLGDDYTTVFELTSATVAKQHWEIKSSVQVRIQ